MFLLHRKKNGIYAKISLFLSYSEVTVATRSSLYPSQMVTAVTRIQYVSSPDGGLAPRKDLYSPERQRRPGLEPQRQIPCKDLVSDDHRDKTTGNRWFFCTTWLCCSLELNCWFRLVRGELAPQLSLVSPKVFFLHSLTDGVLVPCRCRLWLA